MINNIFINFFNIIVYSYILFLLHVFFLLFSEEIYRIIIKIIAFLFAVLEYIHQHIIQAIYIWICGQIVCLRRVEVGFGL
jgi:hypothetical protein